MSVTVTRVGPAGVQCPAAGAAAWPQLPRNTADDIGARGEVGFLVCSYQRETRKNSVVLSHPFPASWRP